VLPTRGRQRPTEPDRICRNRLAPCRFKIHVLERLAEAKLSAQSSKKTEPGDQAEARAWGSFRCYQFVHGFHNNMVSRAFQVERIPTGIGFNTDGPDRPPYRAATIYWQYQPDFLTFSPIRLRHWFLRASPRISKITCAVNRNSFLFRVFRLGSAEAKFQVLELFQQLAAVAAGVTFREIAPVRAGQHRGQFLQSQQLWI